MKAIANKKKRAAVSTLTADRQTAEPRWIDPAQGQQWLERISLGLMLLLGIYLAVVFFEQKAVPNSDFPAFVQIGNEIAHFQMPSTFKRVPVLGLLQVLLSKLMFNSIHPDFTAGLVLNGILYALSIVVFYKICRFYWESTGAICLCLIAALNPWTLAMMVDPIVETAFVCFSLLSLYFILRRSWWCYVFAMIASMTRYECFAWVGLAFLLDLILRPSKREKWKALGFCCLAAVPMVLWLIGTKMHPGAPDSHYYHVLLNVDHRNGLDLPKMLWQTSFSPLLQWPEWIQAIFLERPATQQQAEAIMAQDTLFHSVMGVIALVFFILGCVFICIRKQWILIAAILFWVAYVFVHSMQSVLIDRYTVPVIWLTLFITAYGIKSVWQFTCQYTGKLAANCILVPAVIIALFWIIRLWPAVSKTADVCPASRTALYAGLLLLGVFFIAKYFLLTPQHRLRDIGIFICFGLFIVSNQFALAFRLGKGDTDTEFKQLAAWYTEHCKHGEKLATTMASVVTLFLPGEQKPYIIHTSSISGQNLTDVADVCKRSNITYIAWDSRLGLVPNDYYYKSWGLAKIHPLGSGKDVGPFKLIQKIQASQRRYLYLYRFDPGLMPNP